MLARWIAAVCAAADLPRISTHGMRGVYASEVARAAGRGALDVPSTVAREMGHADHGAVALRHYVQADIRQPGLSIVF